MSFATYFVLEMKSLKAAVQLLQCQRQGRKHGTAVPGSVGPKSILAGTDRMFITCISSRFLDFFEIPLETRPDHWDAVLEILFKFVCFDSGISQGMR